VPTSVKHLGQRSVSPFYAQVALTAPEHPDGWPTDWSDGDAYSLAKNGVAVATISDLDGEVRVSAYLGDVEPSGHDLLAVVPIDLPEGNALVGNSIGADNFFEVKVAPGLHEVGIYVNTRPATSIVFVLT
jgi:hypothetical protein